jgi:hypothetical protein
MNITVTHVIHPDTLNVLQAFINAITGQTVITKPVVNGKAKEVKESKATTTGSETAEAIKITIEQVRASVQKKSQAGKRDQIKTLLSDFGADKVTSLQPDQYATFYEKIEAL